MKKFRWMLLAGLLVAAPQITQAQSPAPSPLGFSDGPSPSSSGPTSSDPRGSSFDPRGGPSSSFPGSSSSFPSSSGGSDVGGISNTTTTTTTGVAPDAGFTSADDAAFGDTGSTSSIPNTGGEPMIAVLAGLSIAGAALVMRRKVTA